MALISEDEGMHYEGYCIRPPSEADSILLQVTLGCSHNRCTFCGSYRDKRFRIKDDEIILSDILFAARHHAARGPPLPDGRRRPDHPPEKAAVDPGADRGAPATGEAGRRLRKREKRQDEIPGRVDSSCASTTSASSTTASRPAMMRSGRRSRKAPPPGHASKWGARVKEAGIQLSVTVLLGIGGRDKSLRHARATGELLSAMDPDFVGALTVMLIPGTPLYRGLPERRLRIARRTRVAQGTARNDQPHQPDKRLLLLESRLQLPADQGKASERQAKGPGFDRCGPAGRGASQAGVDAGFVGSAQRAIASAAAARP